MEEELIFTDMKILPLLYESIEGRFSLYSDEFVVLPYESFYYV